MEEDNYKQTIAVIDQGTTLKKDQWLVISGVASFIILISVAVYVYIGMRLADRQSFDSEGVVSEGGIEGDLASHVEGAILSKEERITTLESLQISSASTTTLTSANRKEAILMAQTPTTLVTILSERDRELLLMSMDP